MTGRALAALLALVASPALAQQAVLPCGNPASVMLEMQTRFGMRLVAEASAVPNYGAVLMIGASGRWALLLAPEEGGKLCLLASGDGWRFVMPGEPG